MRTLLLVLFASFAFAQDQGPDVDPPGRAARLSYINGSVSFQPGGVDDWVPAEPNRPLTTGDRLWSDDNSRVEVNLGSSAFRLSSRTNFTFLNLDDKMAQIQLSLGTMSIRVRHLADDETIEIDTPQVAFTLLRPGEYRLEVNEQGDTTIVTVRGGDAEATANGQAFPVHAREQVRITGMDGSEPVLDRRAAPPTDPFDNFCQDRDRREDMSPSTKYVSRDMPGYADLDANGTWRTDPQYGAVWVPSSVAVGWSPYHFGRWVWVAPWGWTWIDDAAWGYAPFHYGRWAMVAGGGWGWYPGPVAVAPVYAPAMVAFVGGAGFGAALSIGGGGVAVGWFPLGPREVWVPSYHVSAAYITRVNVTNTVVTEVAVRNVYAGGGAVVYANQRVPGAVVAVRGDAFVGGGHIDAAVAVKVPVGAVERAQVMHAAPVAPVQAAVLGGRTPVTGGAHMPPPAAMNRPMVAKVAPPAAPVPFARQQEALKANPGQPLSRGAVRNLEAAQPVSRENIRPVNAAPNVSRPAAPTAPARTETVAPRANPPVVNRPEPKPEVKPEPKAEPSRPPAPAKKTTNTTKRTEK